MTRIAVSGHRGLTPDVEALIDRALRAELEQCRDGELVGLSCLADSTDQLFARAVLDVGGQLEAYVPALKYRDALPEEAHAGYDQLIAQAAAVHQLDHIESTSQPHMDASTEMVKTADRLFAVWDGLPARFGGTADVVDYAREVGVPVTVVWPDGAWR